MKLQTQKQQKNLKKKNTHTQKKNAIIGKKKLRDTENISRKSNMKF